MSSLPLGEHNAVCIGIIDVGTQKDFAKGFSRKIALLWEVCAGDQKKMMSREYRNSLDQQEPLRLHLESWRGKPFTEAELADFELRKVLGTPCKIEIKKKNGQKYVGGVYRLPKTEATPKSNTEYIIFCFDDEATYPSLSRVPGYLYQRIKQSPEAKELERKLKVEEQKQAIPILAVEAQTEELKQGNRPFILPDEKSQPFNECVGYAYEKAIYVDDSGAILYCIAQEDAVQIDETALAGELLPFEELAKGEQEMILRCLASQEDTPEWFKNRIKAS